MTSFDARNEAAAIDRALRILGDAARAEQEKKYLKSDLEFVGMSMSTMRAVVKQFLKDHPKLGRHDLAALVRHLWGEPVFERRAVAVELLDLRGHLLAAPEIKLVEELIRDSRTWALVDPLAVDIAGGLVERFGELNDALDRWAEDEDFWVRRAALLALLKPLRRGDGDFKRFGRYADAMLEEREFFIRKAIGWVLRETSKKRPELVYVWLLPRASRASGLTVREAVKYLTPRQRNAILAAVSPPSRRPSPSGSRRPARRGTRPRSR